MNKALRILAGIFILGISGCIGGGATVKPEEDLTWSRKLGCVQKPEMKWELVQSLDFDTPGLPPGSVVTDGEWEVRDGCLRAIKGEHQRAIMLGKAVAPPVRIEFECTNWADPVQRTIGDITVHLNAVPAPASGLFAKGYSLTTGSYYNNCSTFYREGRPMVKTEYSPVFDGKINHVLVEIIEGHIRYWLNGEIVLEAWDLQPLTEWQDRLLGLRTWNTLMEVKAFRVYQGRIPGK